MPPLDDTLQRLLSMTREAGTPSAVEARAIVTAHLQALGYTVSLQRFTFHPSSLAAFPLFGAGLGGLAMLLIPLLVIPTAPGWGALALLAAGVLTLALLAAGVGLGWVPLGGEPREDANLVATRESGEVTRWIVAHLDTKAQAQSMAGRLVAVWVVAVAVAALIALGAARLRAPLPIEAAACGAALAVLAGALAGRGRLRGTSMGARDNGSGIAAALTAAEHSHGAATGILITGAEEFGMAGARVFARLDTTRSRLAVAVNLDTIDDEGASTSSHDRRGTALARLEAHRLSVSGLSASTELPLGILVDSLPLARAGFPSITIGRLTWRTLRLIHTPKDTVEGLTLAMAREIGRALAVN